MYVDIFKYYLCKLNKVKLLFSFLVAKYAKLVVHFIAIKKSEEEKTTHLTFLENKHSKMVTQQNSKRKY